MNAIAGKRVLLVEDETLVAMMVEDMLTEIGATVVGPASTLADALSLAEGADLDAAVLDINIHGEKSFGVAAILSRRGVPFVFATGYSDADLGAFHETFLLSKPYTQANLQRALYELT